MRSDATCEDTALITSVLVSTHIVAILSKGQTVTEGQELCVRVQWQRVHRIHIKSGNEANLFTFMVSMHKSIVTILLYSYYRWKLLCSRQGGLPSEFESVNEWEQFPVAAAKSDSFSCNFALFAPCYSCPTKGHLQRPSGWQVQ